MVLLTDMVHAICNMMYNPSVWLSIMEISRSNIYTPSNGWTGFIHHGLYLRNSGHENQSHKNKSTDLTDMIEWNSLLDIQLLYVHVWRSCDKKGEEIEFSGKCVECLLNKITFIHIACWFPPTRLGQNLKCHTMVVVLF